MSAATDVAVLVRAHARVGEGPMWDSERGVLHWVDILGQAIHTSDLSTGATTRLQLPTIVGAAAPSRDGFVVASAEGFGWAAENGTYEPRLSFLPDGVRMNDAKVDPLGRFWAGSCAMDFAEGRGALHVLDGDWTYRTVLEGISQPNGLDWSPDGSTFYLVDTVTRELLAFDVDLDSGELGTRRVLTRFGPEVAGVPDGLCVDAQGCLWVAFWGGAQVLRLSADGAVLRTLAVPVAQPSSCAFIGPDLDLLCITSAREGLEPADADSLDGSVLAVAGTGGLGRRAERFAG
jgi:sugar lactone lactonase YvrE